MILNLLHHALLKLQRNRKNIYMASFCMAVSTFVVMLIFIASNAAQELLTSYFYSNSPQLFSITCKIEGDKKYQLTEDEIEALELMKHFKLIHDGSDEQKRKSRTQAKLKFNHFLYFFCMSKQCHFGISNENML